MARLGYLYLNQGFWDGKQLISRKWIEESTKNQISDLKSIDSFTYTYGYYWWPEEISGYSFYCAAGAGGQVIGVIPDLDIVITTTATGLDEVAFKSLLEDYIIPAVIK
jgi:CubicO group peptidase (beta-lactamase class C family)